MTSLASEARLYAVRFKRPVFPLAPKGKHPIVRHGLKHATTNPEVIERWWKKTPDANIGFLCGKGLLVVDVDGPVGRKALHHLEKAHGPLPETVTARTARGQHIFFAVGDRKAPTTAGVLGRGLDTRGDDSYIVAPPSVHPSGKLYQWERPPGTKLAKAPKWLLALLDAHESRRSEPTKGTTPVDGLRARATGYGAGTYRPVDTSRSGVDLALCFRLLRQGWDDDAIAEELRNVSEKAADYSDPESYVLRTVAFARAAHDGGKALAVVKGVWLQHYGAFGGKAAMVRVKMALAVEGVAGRVDAFAVVPTSGYEASSGVYEAVLGDVDPKELAKGKVGLLRPVLGRRLEVAMRNGFVKWMRRLPNDVKATPDARQRRR